MRINQLVKHYDPKTGKLDRRALAAARRATKRKP